MLAPWKKNYYKPRQHIKKQRHHFADKGQPKNWCFWSVVLEKTLESPWTTRRSNQSILKEINPEYSLEGLMFTMKLQYFGHLMQRTDLLEKTLMLGEIEGRRRRGRERMDAHPYMTTGKTIALSRWTFVCKVMSLFFNMLCRLVIAFLQGASIF